MKAIESLSDLVLDPQNANEGTARGTHLLDTSLEKFGAGRGVVVDRNGYVIAGNKSVELALARGLKLKLVESDGTTLVAVQRADLDVNDPRTRELAYLDNRAAEVGLAWKLDQLQADLAAGIELGGMFTPQELAKLLTSEGAEAFRFTLNFETEGQQAQWEAFRRLLEERYPGQSLAAQLDAWVQVQMTHLAVTDPETTSEDA